MANDSLKNKAVKGAGWSAIDNIVGSGVTFVVGIILARLLTPDDYGLIGILLIFITISETIVDSGFSNALIRKQNANETDYSTAFFTNMAVSLILAIGLFGSAGFIADFFNREELILLTQAMSVVIVINALSLVQKARLTKSINFKTQTKVSFWSSIISGVFGIVLAYLGIGVWALVAQQLSAAALRTVLFWHVNKWIPRFIYSIDSFKEMWNFGWKLLFAGLINNLEKEIYKVVIGKYYVPETLGLYTRAKQFMNIFTSNLTNVVGRVSYPVLSTIQDNDELLKAGYRKVIKTTMFLSCVCVFGLASISKSLIFVLLGEKWMDCVPFLQIICFSGVMYPLQNINLNILLVKNRTDLNLKLKIVKSILIFIPLYLGVAVGIYAMILGSVVNSYICFFINSYYSGPLLNYSSFDQIKDILPSFAVAFTVAIPVFLIGYLPVSPYVLLPIQILCALVIFYCVSEKIKLPEYLELKGIVIKFLSKIRGKM